MNKKDTKKVSKSAQAKKPVATKSALAAKQRAHSGLGKGLGALIDAPATPVAVIPRTPIAAIAKPVASRLPANAVLQIPVTEIQRSPWQPRQNFNEAALRELADSISANGIIQPLVCRKLSTGRFELIAGERRLRAAMLANKKQVPIILLEAEDRKAAELAIVENIQRADLNAIEEAEGFRTLSEHFKLTQAEVAERVGKARASVTNALRLLELPDETKMMVADGRLSAGHAKAILGLPDTEGRIRLGRRVVNENMTVRAVERAVAAELQPVVPPKPAKVDLPQPYVRDLIDKLHAHFGTSIRLAPSKTLPNGRKSKGTLEIDFFNNADLDRLLDLLGVHME